MSAERAWVETVKADIGAAFAQQDIIVETSRRLPYAVHVASYRNTDGEAAFADPVTTSHGYQTDLLIAERLEGSTNWVPRVVVEFKLGKVSTHDALTYSAKAATHKNVHPYLRYGIVIGSYDGPVPRRLIRHGHQFDFMVTLASEKLTETDRNRLVQLLQDEVHASRTMNTLFSGKSDVWLVHRKLATAS
jgi:hypothetical protein